jgi:hypothetical protein
MKSLHLVFALVSTLLFLVIFVNTGLGRPKALIGMGIFCAAFWYYFATASPKNSGK